MVELADTLVLEASAERRGSSSLPWGTKYQPSVSQSGRRPALGAGGRVFNPRHGHHL